MIDLIKKIRAHLIINSIVCIALGAFILFKPKLTYHSVVIIFCLYLALLGMISLFNGFQAKKAHHNPLALYTAGVFYVVLAVILYFFADEIIKIVPLLIGVIILLIGVRQLIHTIGIDRNAGINKSIFYIYSVGLIALALFLLIRPVESIVTLFQIYGASLIAIGIIDLLLYIYLRRNFKIHRV